MAGQRTKGIPEIIDCITRGDGIFITSHGGPLSISIDTRGQPSIGVVPDNILLIFHTPMQAVVHSNTIQDTENMRFYSQRNFFKTGMQPGSTIIGSTENCYGTDRYVDPNITARVITTEEVEEEEEEAKKEAEDSEDSDDEEEDGESDEERGETLILQKASLRLNAMALNSEQNCPKANLYLGVKDDDSDRDMDTSDSDDDDYVEDFENFMKRKTTNTTDHGFELLNHIQAFLPGDSYYSQNQSFDEEDIDFDGYHIPPPRQDYRVPDGDRTATSTDELKQQFMNETLPYPLVQYEGNDIQIEYIKQNGETGLRKVYHAGARRHEYFNRAMFGFSHMNYNTSPPSEDPGNPLAGKTISEGASAALPRTTDAMLRYLSQKHTESGNEGLLLVVVNSCSPSKELSSYMKTEVQKLTGEDNILSGRRQTQMQRMIHNLIERNICYWRGRGNFSRIRTNIPWISQSGETRDFPTTAPILPNPLLPHWESGNAQFTRIDEEDRHYTYKFIGQLIAMEREHRLKEAEKGNQNPPYLYFSTPELFFALFTIASCDRRGTIMINLAAKLRGFFGDDWWTGHVNMWLDLAKVQFAPIWSGGAKKKRKKRRKTRKRRKKTKKYRRCQKKRTRRHKKK
tara:strand:- start:836 stop:2716 length:1881 start_codon:yes stop_codon:yes gene_type:complete